MSADAVAINKRCRGTLGFTLRSHAVFVQKVELAKEKEGIDSSVAMLSDTVTRLKRDIDKSRMLVANFAPHLLTAEDMAIDCETLPPGVDYAGTASR